MKTWTRPEFDTVDISNTQWGSYPVGTGKSNYYDNGIKTLNATARLKTPQGSTLPPTDTEIPENDVFS